MERAGLAMFGLVEIEPKGVLCLREFGEEVLYATNGGVVERHRDRGVRTKVMEPCLGRAPRSRCRSTTPPFVA